jgi:insertion element IS1 protein InsB
VGKKKAQQWLWHPIDHRTGAVLTYAFGRRQDKVLLKLKALLEPFGILRYHMDYCGANPGKRHTQKIERKHLSLRTRTKHLTRKTICFSSSTHMHDIIIELFVNGYEFGLPV